MDINPCNICGEVPELRRSHSRRLISHKCYDITTGWGNRIDVINKWNSYNSQNIIETNSAGAAKPNALKAKISQLVIDHNVAAYSGCNGYIKLVKQLEKLSAVEKRRGYE